MNTSLRALVNQAERLVRTEAYEEAIALCHAILRRHPRYARAYRMLAEAHLGLGEHGTAADLFRRALGVDPEDPVGYAGLGIIFAERGLREEAIWQLERAFELAPGRDGLRRELARLYEERGTSAQVQLTRAALARLYTRGGLWNKAIGELRDLVAREPYRLDLRATLARTLWRAGQREEAAQVAQTALDQAPNCLVARLILGAYWCDEGRDDEGRRLLAGARELDPEGREAVRLLGRGWPQLLDAGPEEVAEPEPEVEAEAEEPAPPIPRPQTPADAGLPPWVERSDTLPAGGDHIATLPGASVEALLGGLPAEDAAVEPGPFPALGPEEVAEPPALDEPEEEGWPPPAVPAAPEAAESPARDDAPPEQQDSVPQPTPAPLTDVEAPAHEPAMHDEPPLPLEPPPPAREPAMRDEAPLPPVRRPSALSGLFEEPEQAPPAAGGQPVEDALPSRRLAPLQAPFGNDAPSPLLAPPAVWQRRLDVAPDDHDARLALAQALVASGRLAEALPHYDTLSTQPSYLERVIADLEAIAKTDTSDRTLRERLGDAYARAGRFQDALRMYHWQPPRAHTNDNAAGG